MAAKRNASSDLNADNWNQDDEPEDPGTFKKASDETLSKRVIKTAKRRYANTDGPTKSAFGTFSGFQANTSTKPSSPFSFLANSNSTTSPLTSTSASSSLFTNKAPTTNGSTKISENGIGTNATTTSLNLQSKDEKTKPLSTEKESTKPPEYYAKLKGLNQSVARWIKKHVDENPVCILTPIFRDYEKHLKEIELKHGKETDSAKTTQKKTETSITAQKDLSASTEKKESFVFGASKSSSDKSSNSWKPESTIFGNSTMATKSVFSSMEKSDNKSIFSTSDKLDTKSPFSATSTMIPEKNPFLSKTGATETKKDEESAKTEEKPSSGLTFPQTSISSAATFSFGQNSSSGATAAAGFSFGTGKPFTFGSAAVKSQESGDKPANNEEKEDEDDEPPKPEFKPVTEEGSIYEQKCKVFVKKDSNYSDRGVGTLFLKPAPNDKMQLIVRAVNSLGNLLLNTLLTESIPIKRLNKTNIMLVCLPLPTADPPPVATLLRVKTSEEADALFETLEKHKK